ELVHLKDEPMKMAKIESAVRIVLDFYAAFNRQDVDGMLQLIHETAVLEDVHPAPDGTYYIGKEKIAAFWIDYFRNNPVAQIELEDVFGLGLRCVARWRLTLSENPGKHNHLRGLSLFQVKEGRICEILSYSKC
ncbi:MAG: nuclear transport factor 2 family protein, partial [Anaerolineales bacterium]